MSIKATQPEDSAVPSWSEKDTMAAIRATCAYGTVKLTSEHGPYDIDRPTFKCDRFVEAIVAARDAHWNAALATPSPQLAATKEAGGEALRNVQRYRMSTQFHSMNRDDAGPYVQLDDVLTALAAAPQPAEAKTAVERIRHAGAMLSNCAFNMAQRKPGEPLTEGDIRALDESRKAWDAAIATQEGGR